MALKSHARRTQRFRGTRHPTNGRKGRYCLRCWHSVECCAGRFAGRGDFRRWPRSSAV